MISHIGAIELVPVAINHYNIAIISGWKISKAEAYAKWRHLVLNALANLEAGYESDPAWAYGEAAKFYARAKSRSPERSQALRLLSKIRGEKIPKPELRDIQRKFFLKVETDRHGRRNVYAAPTW